MIRATAGTWVNYATTFAFQILFAARYGTTRNASAFVITFGIAAALSGILGSSVQSVAVPRLLSLDGALLSSTVRFMRTVTALGLAVCLAVAFLSGPTAGFVAHRTGLPFSVFRDLLLLTAAFAFVQLVAGELAAVALALGHRLLPAISPVIPSTVAALGLILYPGLDVRVAYGLLAAGTVLQIAVLVAGFARPVRFDGGEVPHVAVPAVIMLISYSLLALIPPLERLVAAAYSTNAAAQYDYAIRSLRAAQQLILGGIVMAALGSWSALAARGQRKELEDSLAVATAISIAGLAFAVSVALVAGHDLVAIVYQHGRFKSGDTRAVTEILLFALPGFFAEGLSQVLTSALAALRQNILLALIGFGTFCLRTGLILMLGLRAGAVGIAAAYSVGAVLMLMVLLALTMRRSFWSKDRGGAARKSAIVACGTLGIAGVIALSGINWPSILSSSVVALTFCLLLWRFQLVPALRWLP